MSTLACQFCCQLASERLQRLLQTLHLFFVGMHKFDIFWQWFTQSLRHRLCTPVGHKSPTNFCFYLLLKLLDPALEFIFFKTLFKFCEILRCLLAVCFHQFVEHVVKIKVSQRSIQVIRPTHRASRFHSRKTLHRLASKCSHHCLIAVHQCLHQHLRNFFGSERIHPAAASRSAFTLLLHLLFFAPQLCFGVSHLTRNLVFWSAQREVHLKDGFKCAPVRIALDKSCSQCIFKCLAILNRDLLDGFHCIQVFRQTDRQTRFS